MSFLRPGPRNIALTLALLLSLVHCAADAFVWRENQSLSLPAQGPGIDFSKVKSLGVYEHVMSNLFERPIQFPKLEDVYLHTLTNSDYLEDLVRNYSGLQRLTIMQASP